MRLLFIADGRSPIALNWINYFLDGGHEVHLASTFACSPDERLASLEFIPAAFSGIRTQKAEGNAGAQGRGWLWGASMVRARTAFRQWIGPFTLARAARRLGEVIARVQPDLVHAMRIPYEGMLAALADPTPPLLISVWGNDFTLHARSTPLMGRFTRKALSRADALHTDCHRDLRLAHAWGFPDSKPGIVLPGAGGIQPGLFYPPGEGGLGNTSPVMVINPRGIRAYLRNDVFFRAIPTVLAHYPETRFFCTTMAGERTAERMVSELGIGDNVELLPRQTRSQMADLFRRCQVVVSPSEHDGTPNTILEAMACGCLPIAGDIEALREWITSGVNGLLVDLDAPEAMAAAILAAIERPEFRRRAGEYNTRLIARRADYDRVMADALDFYKRIM